MLGMMRNWIYDRDPVMHTLNPRGKKPVDYGLIEAMTITATAFWLEGVRDLARAAGVGVP